MNAKKRIWWLAPALLVSATLAEAGGGVLMYGAGEVPEASEVANILSGGASQIKRPKMRGISLDSAYKPQAAVEKSLKKIAKPTKSAIGLPVEFAFNSAEILPENKPQLDAVAEGIKMTNGVSVVVEGHTDAFGSDETNLKLSTERAESVKAYMLANMGLADSQVTATGYGEARPIANNETQEGRAKNRRIDIVIRPTL